MSTADRYHFEIDSPGFCDICGATSEKCESGDFVLYEDYLLLDEIVNELGVDKNKQQLLKSYCDELELEIARVKAENEQLKEKWPYFKVLDRRNKRLEKALNVYADKDNWLSPEGGRFFYIFCINDGENDVPTEFMDDVNGYELAQEALKNGQ